MGEARGCRPGFNNRDSAKILGGSTFATAIARQRARGEHGRLDREIDSRRNLIDILTPLRG